MCSVGYYGHTTQRKCLKCDDSCRTCADGISPNRCTSCPDAKYLLNEKCLDSCTSNHTATMPLIRLAGNRPVETEGRVELNVDGKWKTLCGYNMNLRLANVICRQLGLGYAISYDRNSKYGPGKGQVVNDYYNCTGNELNVFRCFIGNEGTRRVEELPEEPALPYRYRYPRYCYGHSKDAGVSCSKLPLIIPGNRCVGNCPNASFKSAKDTCFPCNRRCEKCVGDKDICRSCRAGFFLKESLCISSCGYKKYGDLETRTCKNCDSSVCTSCYNGRSPRNCSVCKNSLVSNDGNCIKSCGEVKKLRMGSKCVTKCGDKTYKNATGDNCLRCTFPHTWDRKIKKCIVCPERCGLFSCTRVNGTDYAICNKCNEGYFLSADKTSCLPCLKTCASCNVTSSKCTSCNNPLYLRDSSCVKNCTVGFVETDMTGRRKCVKQCSNGFFLNSTTSKCEACNSSCVTCNFNKDNCVTCGPERYLQCAVNQEKGCPANSTTCVAKCSRGFFLDSSKTKCIKCDPSCATCVNETTLCTSCKPPLRYLKGSKCYSNCSGEYTSTFSAKIRLANGRDAMEGRVEV